MRYDRESSIEFDSFLQIPFMNLQKISQSLPLAGLLLMAACIQEIPLDLPSSDQQFVISSLVSDQAPCKLYLTKTISITEQNFPVLANASIQLYDSESNELIDSLSYAGDSFYQGHKILSKGHKHLSLKVVSDGRQLTAHTYIPSKVAIRSAERRIPAGYDQYGDPITEYRVSFKDPAEEENFYDLYFLGYFGDGSDFIRSNEELAYIDPVIREENLEDYENKSLLFSDQLFNGKDVTIVVRYYAMSSVSDVSSVVDTTRLQKGITYALLRNVSKQYYQYRKDWTIHRYTQQKEPAALQQDPLLQDFSRFLFIGDPVPMSSNVQNGLGVFAGFSQDLQPTTKIDLE